MSASAFYSPWGDLPACNSLRINGVNFSFPEGAAPATGKQPAGEICPCGDSDTPAGKFPARDSEGPAGVNLSDEAQLFLRLIAAHHRCDLAGAIERASALYCNTIIGLQRCADLKQSMEARPPP